LEEGLAFVRTAGHVVNVLPSKKARQLAGPPGRPLARCHQATATDVSYPAGRGAPAELLMPRPRRSKYAAASTKHG
jgi:hypothetical protein